MAKYEVSFAMPIKCFFMLQGKNSHFLKGKKCYYDQIFIHLSCDYSQKMFENLLKYMRHTFKKIHVTNAHNFFCHDMINELEDEGHN